MQPLTCPDLRLHVWSCIRPKEQACVPGHCAAYYHTACIFVTILEQMKETWWLLMKSCILKHHWEWLCLPKSDLSSLQGTTWSSSQNANVDCAVLIKLSPVFKCFKLVQVFASAMTGGNLLGVIRSSPSLYVMVSTSSVPAPSSKGWTSVSWAAEDHEPFPSSYVESEVEKQVCVLWGERLIICKAAKWLQQSLAWCT